MRVFLQTLTVLGIVAVGLVAPGPSFTQQTGRAPAGPVDPAPAPPAPPAIPPAVFIPPGEGTTGTWLIANVPNAPWVLLMEQKGANVTGTIRQTVGSGARAAGGSGSLTAMAQVQPAILLEGAVKGKTLKFNTSMPGSLSDLAAQLYGETARGDGMMKFEGDINGETISLSRTGGLVGAAGLFGASGARQFTATRQVNQAAGAASLPRQAPDPENCNQPMPDAITRVPIAGDASSPVSTRDGCWIFVTVGSGHKSKPPYGVSVLRRNGAAFEQLRFTPINVGNNPRVLGAAALTHDEKTLIVPVGSGRVDLLDVGKLTSGQGDPFIGSLTDAHFGFTANMAVTFDDKRLFVGQASTSWISIVDLDKARAGQFASAVAGGIPVNGAPRVSKFSPDQRYLYVSVMIEGTPAPPECKRFRGEAAHPIEIQVIDVERALSHPDSSVIARFPAGCSTGDKDVAVSSDGNTLYAIADGDSALRTFDVRPLRVGSPPKLVGKLPMRADSLRLALIDGDSKLIVTSSEFLEKDFNQPQMMTVLDTAKLSSGDAVLATVSVGVGWGTLSVTPDGRTILAAARTSQTVSIVDWARILREQAKSSPPR